MRLEFRQRLRRAGAAARPAGAGLLCALGLHGAARMLGELFVLAVRDRGVGEMIRPFGLFMGAALVAIIGWFLIARRRGRGLDWISAGLAATIYVGIGWALSLRGAPDGVPFGRIRAMSPGGFWEDTPSRPRVYYTISERGFRGSEFSDEKHPLSFRVVVIGDSYVFGSGVPDEETLPRRIEAAVRTKRRLEVINLGIPGDNIASHVDLYEEANARLSPDLVVIGLTLPNDMSRWDGQDERRGAHRFGGFSLASWLFGGRPAIFLAGELLLARGPDEASLAHFRKELARLGRDRAAGGAEVLLFAYSRDAAILPSPPPGASRLLTAEPNEAYFIPGDGHPTAAGNRAFAAQIAPFIEAAKPRD